MQIVRAGARGFMNGHRGRGLAFVAAIATLSGGCGGDFQFNEDLDERFLECGLKSCTPGLRAPYALGAEVRIEVDDERRWLRETDFSGWTVVSEDESVFAIEGQSASGVDGERLDVVGRAAGEGTTEITLLDEDGDAQASAEIEVRTPNRITMRHRGTQEDVSTDAPIRVLAGETATFDIFYWDDETPLHGGGIASTEPEVDVDEELALAAEIVAQGGADHVQLSPMISGTIPVSVEFSGEGSEAVEVLGVGMPEIAGLSLVEIEGFDGRDAVYARLVDASGEHVYGAPALWSTGMTALDGSGDVCLYSKKAESELQLRATLGEHEAEVTVRGEHPSVHSTNDFSCSVGGAGSTGWGLLMLTLGALRRRRWSAQS